MLDHTKGKLDDEEDEGVAQNSSIEDRESIQSSETERQGETHEKSASQDVTETKDIKPKGTEELLNGVDDQIIIVPVDQNRKLSPTEAAEVHGNSSPKRQSSERRVEEDDLSEEERRKKNYEAEMKSWLMERMQVPIEGRQCRMIFTVFFN